MKLLNRFLLPGLLLPLLCCNAPDNPEIPSDEIVMGTETKQTPRYSLGQWSFNREHFAGEMTTFDFVAAAGELGFDGVDYVSQFFSDKAEDSAFLDSLKAAAKAAGVESVMILVDGAGNLGASKAADRENSIHEHMKWVKAARHIGAPAIRVNAHGDGSQQEIKAACIEAIGQLAREAKAYGVQIVVENHGGISNNGAWLADLVGKLQDYNVASLADFDNWCTARANGQLWGAECTERYDRYQGMTELMPHAASVSVKTFNFDAAGNETGMDYATLFDIIHASGYDGWLGIEYEGDGLPSREGIAKNLALAKKSWKRQPVIDDAARARLDSTLEAFVAPAGVAGISALIYEKGKEVYFNARGDADRNAGVEMDRNIIVQIYSMTKPLTGTALMQLYEQDKFDLDDPVAKYIPELAGMQVFAGVDAAGKVLTEAPKRSMTIRDLTRHTAGFYNGGNVSALNSLRQAAGIRNTDHTLTELAEKHARIPLLFHPGEQWEYGPSVDIQALVVERISGQPFGEYLRDKVLEPLGMSKTRYFVPEEDRSHLSAAYHGAKTGL